MTTLPSIDVPFEYRHTCWFCGEPYFECHTFRPVPNYDGETPVRVPCCEECYGICAKTKASGLDILRDRVKEKLHSKYQKHLQIGVQWTKEELEDSELEGKAFEGFKHSAWRMFEIARERVNYPGWPLAIDGQPVGQVSSAFQVTHDGIVYPSLSNAVEQLAKSYAIPQAYLEQSVELVGRAQLGFAIRFCKTTHGFSEAQQAASLVSLKERLAEEAALDKPSAADAGIEVALKLIAPQILYRTEISPYAVQWALRHGISTLAQLAEQEEQFLAHFGQDSELTAFHYFTGLQVYLEKRAEDPHWAEQDDPNRQWFQKLTGKRER
ncbi:FYVE zinc finger domain-containing protein [Photobacterium sp. 1_MG-2023]|uniref:FYVE zinc finger domain-containing protein n=1 Tax=Photobacterium sp. 1_MG-2023 TaxID=3062646 RepID=UPI0026E2FF8B|nr:FYVE zinc finger domain-containing protein [Photobacterium sp. 1_MG-2023]MDO6705376.1 FYVE zinc finger domain-containing protein [Photobacterium sp. 1_MG-2023]